MRLNALALLSGAGQVERSSETFKLRYSGAAELVQQSPELGRLLAGEADRAALSVAGIQATIEAVTDAGGTRRALLTFGADPSSPAAQASNALLSEPLDDCAAIVWLKDLDGRYLRVNRHYTTHLGVSEDRFRGRTDTELAPRESIDGPRLHERDQATTEPLQLEYTVPEYEGRPALAVLRFPVRDRTGQPVAVCCVAAPVEAAHVAHTEAARLMEIERFSRLDGNAVRAEFLREWGLMANGTGDDAPAPAPLPPAAPPPPAPQVPAPQVPAPQAPAASSAASAPVAPTFTAQPPAASVPGPAPEAVADIDEPVPDLAAERDSALAARAELGRELAHAQLRLVELDTVRAQAEAAHLRVEELEREVNEARARAAEAEALTIADAEQVRAEADQVGANAEPRAELEPSVQRPLDHRQGSVRGEDDEGLDAAVRWLPTAQRKLSASLGRMSVWRTVLKETATIIGSEGGWDAVTAWVPDDEGGLSCAATWTSHPGLSNFESETWDVAQARAGSLPAQALHAPHLTWVTEIDAVDDDRLGSAAAHGLRSALLLPIRDGAATIALLELLAHASVEPHAQIAMSLEAAALQLGQFGHMLRVSA